MVEHKLIERCRRRNAETVRRRERDKKYPQCDVWMWGKKGSPGPHKCTSRGTFGVVSLDGNPYALCGFHGRRPDLWIFSVDAAIRRHRARRDIPEYDGLNRQESAPASFEWPEIPYQKASGHFTRVRCEVCGQVMGRRIRESAVQEWRHASCSDDGTVVNGTPVPLNDAARNAILSSQ